MLKELPIEFKDVIKEYSNKEGFIGLLDGLFLDSNVIKGKCILIFDSIENFNKINSSNLLEFVGNYQESNNINDLDFDINLSPKDCGVAYLNDNLPFISKEEIIHVI